MFSFLLHAVRQPFVAKIYALIWIVRLGLWLLPFQSLCTLTEKITKLSIKQSHNGWPAPKQIGAAVAYASRFVPSATCLTQALVAQLLLRRYGHAAVLRIGVARERHDKLAAHAWVENGETVVVGDTGHDVARYQMMPVLDMIYR